jgi:hypothetical protein
METRTEPLHHGSSQPMPVALLRDRQRTVGFAPARAVTLSRSVDTPERDLVASDSRLRWVIALVLTDWVIQSVRRWPMQVPRVLPLALALIVTIGVSSYYSGHQSLRRSSATVLIPHLGDSTLVENPSESLPAEPLHGKRSRAAS